jgi:hypothetical protein
MRDVCRWQHDHSDHAYNHAAAIKLDQLGQARHPTNSFTVTTEDTPACIVAAAARRVADPYTKLVLSRQLNPARAALPPTQDSTYGTQYEAGPSGVKDEPNNNNIYSVDSAEGGVESGGDVTELSSSEDFDIPTTDEEPENLEDFT